MENNEWLPPERLPDLTNADEIAIDLETYDPGLKEKGPGWARNQGKVVGVALAVDGWKGYSAMKFIRYYPGQTMENHCRSVSDAVLNV